MEDTSTDVIECEHWSHWHSLDGRTKGFKQWRNFSPIEMACKGTGRLKLNVDAMDKLQALRNRIGKPLYILSAYRSPEHNKAVKGAPNSMHLQGCAFDVAMTNLCPADFVAAARAVGFTGIGLYEKQNFIHIDTGRERSWGKWAYSPGVL